MPDPFDLLKKGWDFANSPIIPQEYADQAADFYDSPSLDRSPNEARLAGFGAGALQGANSLLTPLNIGLSMLPFKGQRVPAASPAPMRPPIPQPNLPAEMIEVGGEGAYNATRPGRPEMDGFYRDMLAKLGGRGR